MSAHRLATLPLVQIGVIFLAVAGIGVVNTMREARKPPRFDTYSTNDRFAGGYLAWYELLAREGLRAERFEERLGFLDRTTGVLVTAAPDFAAVDLVPADAPALAAWVRDGGHVVMVGNGPFAAIASDDLKLPKTTEKRSTHSPLISQALRRFGVQSYRPRWKTRLSPRRADDILLRDARGTVALRYPLGRGEVLDVVDGSMFRNADIDRADHARLAYALVALMARSGAAPIRFDEALHGYVTPEHWWQILPSRFVVAVAFAVVVLTIAMTGAALRLGPPRQVEQPRAPTSAEYLDAIATLYQRAGAAHGAIAAMAASLDRNRTADRRSGGLRVTSPSLAATVNALEILQKEDQPSGRDFVRAAKLAYAARNDPATYRKAL
ncbi:MAG: DUF4350 domain-containing protein [Candidatus Eremiobacteraeota bacterium]|nr:DUF4350 domain-containing protein [Candidatus Eremiobacteraeota bacterium]